MNKKTSNFLVLLLALLSCLTQNLIVVTIITGILIAFSVFKTKNEDLTVKLIQPALISIAVASFKGIFSIIISAFYRLVYYGFNGKTKFITGLFRVTYFTDFIGDIALVVFVIMGIIAFSQGKNIKYFGDLANNIYNTFAKKDNSIENK